MPVPCCQEVEGVLLVLGRTCRFNGRGEILGHEVPGNATPTEGIRGGDVQGQIPNLLVGEVVIGREIVVDDVGPVEGTEVVGKPVD